ncbi:hypothetical protein [Acinetobacter sp. 10FS3-1]|uniref:hypothetical protein n=1 Tax=Acinetobacter sp. 10FS3-1 TaxID=2563897 RepID=UPI00157E21D8|nr:hypothetical protein [Acinetobacter sp. 10FS3-1]QKQ69176.1 hypothetical protein E5Y90_02420 [Acinetobacter sp. 10FS3-1]
MINQQLSTKLSALALALLLAGCGGGGSEGYYNTGTDQPSTGGGADLPEENKLTNVQIQYLPLVEKLNARGDTYTVSVRVMNEGAILPNMDVKVESTDASKNKAAIEYISSETGEEGSETGFKTDGQGIARFNIKIDSGLSEEVIAEILKGVQVKVSVNDSKGKTLASEPFVISSYDPKANQDVESPSKYDLSIFTDKQALAVMNDRITVQVRLKALNSVDTVNNKPVHISLENQLSNISIESNQVASTNTDGYVAFTIASASGNLTDQQIASMLAQGLKYKIHVVEQGVVTLEESKVIDLVKYIDESLNGGIESFESKVKLGALKSSNENYVQQVELALGDEYANQDITISSRAIEYSKGQYYFSNNIGLYPLSSTICTLNNSPVKNENGFDWNNNPITYTSLVSEKLKMGGKDINNVVYLNKAGAIDSKYSFLKVKTDDKGKAIIDLVYDKSYSKWLKLSLSARVENQSVPFGFTYDFQLPLLETDYDDQTAIGPNMISPFGTSDDCFNAQ